MSRRVYLSRDGCNDETNVELYLHKPKYDKDAKIFDYPMAAGFLIDFCYEEFLKITRFKIKPGEYRRVRINIEEV